MKSIIKQIGRGIFIGVASFATGMAFALLVTQTLAALRLNVKTGESVIVVPKPDYSDPETSVEVGYGEVPAPIVAPTHTQSAAKPATVEERLTALEARVNALEAKQK